MIEQFPPLLDCLKSSPPWMCPHPGSLSLAVAPCLTDDTKIIPPADPGGGEGGRTLCLFHKPRSMEIPQDFFLITPGWKFHFFFIWPLKFPETKTCSSFINTHGNSMSYQLPCCLDFLWNSPFLRRYLNEALGTMDECLKPAASFLNWLIKKNQLQGQNKVKCVNFSACYTKC